MSGLQPSSPFKQISPVVGASIPVSILLKPKRTEHPLQSTMNRDTRQIFAQREIGIASTPSASYLYVHNGGFPSAISPEEARHLSLVKLQRKVIHCQHLALITVVHLLHAVEPHPRLFLADRQVTDVALLVCVPYNRKDTCFFPGNRQNRLSSKLSYPFFYVQL